MQVRNSSIKLLGAMNYNTAINLKTLLLFCLILLNKYFKMSSLSCVVDPFTHKLVHSESRQEVLPQSNHDDLKQILRIQKKLKQLVLLPLSILKNWKLTVTIPFWSV